MSGFEDVVDDEDFVSAPAWFQLAVMVNDGSGSMTLEFNDDSIEEFAPVGTKAAAVETALRALIKEMQSGSSPENYHFSFISFNDRVTDQRLPRRLIEISSSDSYDPTKNGTGGTAIHRGLDAAASIVEAYLREAQAGELPASAIVVVMSDGEERDDPRKTAASAERIRALNETDLAACLFATKGRPAEGEPLLESIVSRPNLYQRVYNAKELRKFFRDSVTGTRPRLMPPSR
jgi:uncharacterized protein YegL